MIPSWVCLFFFLLVVIPEPVASMCEFGRFDFLRYSGARFRRRGARRNKCDKDSAHTPTITKNKSACRIITAQGICVHVVTEHVCFWKIALSGSLDAGCPKFQELSTYIVVQNTLQAHVPSLLRRWPLERVMRSATCGLWDVACSAY